MTKQEFITMQIEAIEFAIAHEERLWTQFHKVWDAEHKENKKAYVAALNRRLEKCKAKIASA